jgi:hypothetical protein
MAQKNAGEWRRNMYKSMEDAMKSRKAIGILSVLMVAVMYASVAFAAVCPEVTDLGVLKNGSQFSPLRVALDAKGNSYVSDNFYDTISIYNRKGARLRNTHFDNPLGIAVDGDGRVYIGRSKGYRGFHSGEVGVYDANLNLISRLGSGWGEFNYPAGITVSGGRVYVSDGVAHLIKIYNAEDGSFIEAVGGYGTGDGSLVKPQSVQVLDIEESLYVATSALPVGLVNSTYSVSLTAAEGVAPYAWTMAAGSLPSGLALDGAGGISGTPTTEGTFGFTVQVADANGDTATRDLTIEVGPAYVPPDPTIDLLSDDFEDGVMGSQWTYVDGSSAGVSETGGQLRLTADGTGGVVFRGYESSNSILPGEFDIQVDFSGYSVNGASKYPGAYLKYEVDAQNWFTVMLFEEAATGTRWYYGEVAIGGAVAYTMSETVTDSAGKFRIARDGSGNISLYYWGGSAWTLLHSASGVSSSAGKVQLVAVANSVVLSVDFDNFKDNLFVPSEPSPEAPSVIGGETVTIAGGDRLYVADRALIYSSGSGGSGWAIGAGGHIFEKTGAFIKRFGNYGWDSTTPGNMISPVGLVLDNSDRVLISDYNKGVIHAFDLDGNAVCDYSLGESTPLPLGMAVGEDGRLLVAMLGGVAVYGLDDYVGLEVSPDLISYDTGMCASGQVQKSLTIANDGPGVLSWTITTSAAWIVPSVTAGEINGTASVNVGIAVDPAVLGTGTHNGTITVTAQGAEETVRVVVNVPEPPVIDVGPESMTFEARGTEVSPPDTLTVSVLGEGSVQWSAASDAAWVSVSPSTGSTDTVYVDNVSVNTAALDGMAQGVHSGVITVSSTCAKNSPLTMPVSLTLIKGGVIEVTTNFEDATFTITGPENHTGSGTYFKADGVPEGTYTVTYDHVQGLIEPSPQVQQVANGETTVFAGSYIDLRERNNIIATAGEVSWLLPDELRIFSGDGVLQSTIEITPANPAIEGARFGSETATGDVDGDGQDDIIVGHDRGVISGYSADGTPIGFDDFMAFPYASDVVVETADLDGDGRDEIVVGAGDRNGLQSAIRVFSYSDGVVSDTGVNFLAYQKKRGVNLASGDVDGDGADELITTLGGGGQRNVMLRVWKLDATGGEGAWTVQEVMLIEAGVGVDSTRVASGDLDADGRDEILVALPLKDGYTKVVAYSEYGGILFEFTEMVNKGMNLTAADMDFDGTAEVVVGNNNGIGITVLRIYNSDGTYRGEFDAFENDGVSGVRVSLGQMAEPCSGHGLCW